LSRPLPTGFDGEYIFHEFRHDGVGSTATVTSIEVMQKIQSAEILIIGGGGGGGGSVPKQHRGGGGGGAGRLLWYKGIDLGAGVLDVTVGAGGSGGKQSNDYSSGDNGISSNFLGYTAIGGGAGGGVSLRETSTVRDGHSGGSGGGGGDPTGAGGYSIGTNSQQSFGNRGGSSVANTRAIEHGAGGGGGGAGGHGSDTSGDANENPGPGGSGKLIRITGTMIEYASGGNGNIATNFAATVQHMGHGGHGANGNSAGEAAGDGGVGSSGVVVIRYKRQGTLSLGGLVAGPGVLITRYSKTNLLNSSTCVACPPGSDSAGGSTLVSDCVCSAGWTGSKGMCTPCLRGTYKQGPGESACLPCHANAMTEHEAAASSDLCECQANLGWSQGPGERTTPSCSRVVGEIGWRFVLAVALSDFANDVEQVQTKFTNALALAYGVDAVNVTLVYYETHATGSPSPGLRRLLQQAPPPTTTVEAKVKVFVSIPRISTDELSAHLRASVPGIKIHELHAVSGNDTPAQVPTAKNDTGTDFGLYAAGGGGGLLLLLFGAVVLTVVLRQRCSSTQTTQTNDYDDDDQDPSTYEEEDNMGQTMESTAYHPQNMRPPVLQAHCADARGAYVYNGRVYKNAYNYL